MHAKHRKRFWGLVVVAVVGISVTASQRADFGKRLEWLTFDARTAAFRAQREPSPEIAVVLVDEASLRALNPIAGRWPWPRSLFADVLEFMAWGGARAVVFDILFTENERSDGQASGSINPHDAALAEATKASGIAYHAAQILRDAPDEFNKTVLNRPLPRDFVERFAVRMGAVDEPSRDSLPSSCASNNFYIPFSELYRFARGVGVVDLEPDADGVFRRVVPLRRYGDDWFPSLGLAPLIASPEIPQIHLAPRSLKIGETVLPLAPDGTYLVNPYGGFDAYSVSGVLAALQMLREGEMAGLPINPREFRDKIVFIGTSAAGLEDLKATSVSSKTPGVYLHATVASNALQNDFLHLASPAAALVLTLLLTAVVVAGIFAGTSLWVHLSLPLLTGGGYIAWAGWRFAHNAVWPFFSPLAAVGSAWLLCSAYLAFTEGRARRRVRRMFSQYVSPAVLSEVVDGYQDQLRAEVGRKEHLTILFSDIRGFTSLSETLSPARIVELLNVYFSSMSEAIFQHEGTIDKFIGDAIMCFWGAPVRVADHPLRAVRTALTMIARLETVNRDLEAGGYPTIQIGVGINTGNVVLGNIGSEHKLDYTVIGDDVNLASRLEGLTKIYGTPILFAESTRNLLGDELPCGLVDLVRVKGKKVPIRIYRPLVSADATPREVQQAKILARQIEAAFETYSRRDWSAALERYLGLPRDGVTEIFLKRCRTHQEVEPTAWDGAHTLDRK